MALIRRIFKRIFRQFGGFIFWVFPIQKNKVVISSYSGRGYGDNPKYIVEALLKKEKKLKIVWIVNSENDSLSLPANVDFVKKDTWKALYHLATARVWVDNCRKGIIYKRRKQRYLQTWHGFALKRIERDAENSLSKSYKKWAKKDSNRTDVIVSCSHFMTNIYRNSFWYNGEIAEWGSPRNDMLIQKDCMSIKKVRQFYNIEEAKKIVLYAPTFRADYSTNAYAIDYNRLRNSCQERFGGCFIVLVRLHPNIVDKCEELSFNENVINATYYPDIQELLSASDICVSDYSSLMFDFALSKKPCFQFAVDLEEYKKDRNFYFEIDKLPFPLSTNNNDLEKEILSFDGEKYSRGIDDFFANVGMILDGKGSERCAEWIIKNMN